MQEKISELMDKDGANEIRFHAIFNKLRKLSDKDDSDDEQKRIGFK